VEVGRMPERHEVEAFLALAEELHFGRTAERLHVSTTRISQTIRKLERGIGASLFDRTSRRVTLTPIGRQLRDELRPAYDEVLQSFRNATAAGRGVTGTLTLGVFGPHVYYELGHILDLFGSRHPDCELAYREVHLGNPFGPLRAGEVDVQTLWLPIREPDITVGPVVFTDDRLVVVAADHPLAKRDSVSLEDLGDYTVVEAHPPLPDYWEEAVLPFRTPGRRQVTRGPKVSTFQELLAVVIAGRAVSVVHGEAARYYQRPGITYVPIHDASPSQFALIWRTAAATPLINAFVQAARDAAVTP
jgi:DNA-binding transcriptional LysR family regulator